MAVPRAVGGECLIQNSSGHTVEGEQGGKGSCKGFRRYSCLSLEISKFRAWAVLLGGEEVMTAVHAAPGGVLIVSSSSEWAGGKDT